ncbi:hypothetical protein BC834DRAFT_988969 [Gloeopeniophorella convolvens]|nr:hypothetical protein BC834DRAFT_988969 [Gloeopeniophorella convolvens]
MAPRPPPHILAVHSSPSSKHPVPDAAFLVPTHHIVLAAHCAHIPRLPVSHAQPRPGGALALPAAETFVPLHAFLVAHCASRLVGVLLPLPPAMLVPARTAAYLAADAAGSKMSALMALTRHVTGVWRNACALGVFDRDLWAALDWTWEVLLGAMNMVAAGTH